jgi:RNA polymerase-binding transcription factor DksA
MTKMDDISQDKPLLHKSAEVQQLLAQVFPVQIERRKNGLCATCGKEVDFAKFQPIDLAEYKISGMCLTCQTLVFGEANEEI